MKIKAVFEQILEDINSYERNVTITGRVLRWWGIAGVFLYLGLLDIIKFINHEDGLAIVYFFVKYIISIICLIGISDNITKDDYYDSKIAYVFNKRSAWLCVIHIIVCYIVYHYYSLFENEVKKALAKQLHVYKTQLIISGVANFVALSLIAGLWNNVVTIIPKNTDHGHDV